MMSAALRDFRVKVAYSNSTHGNAGCIYLTSPGNNELLRPARVLALWN